MWGSEGPDRRVSHEARGVNRRHGADQVQRTWNAGEKAGLSARGGGAEGWGGRGGRKASSGLFPRHKDTVLSQARQVQQINKADTLSRGVLRAGRAE